MSILHNSPNYMLKRIIKLSNGIYVTISWHVGLNCYEAELYYGGRARYIHKNTRRSLFGRVRLAISRGPQELFTGWDNTVLRRLGLNSIGEPGTITAAALIEARDKLLGKWSTPKRITRDPFSGNFYEIDDSSFQVTLPTTLKELVDRISTRKEDKTR